MTRPDDSASPIVYPGYTYGDGSVEPTEIRETGLTKREYFAAKIMAALWSDLPTLQKSEEAGADVDQWTVSRAVQLADTLIEALNRPQ